MSAGWSEQAGVNPLPTPDSQIQGVAILRHAWRAAFGTGFFSIVLLGTVPQSLCAAALVATVGQEAPAFLLEDLAGAPVSAKGLRGKPLYINVFASWCPPCRAELPEIVRSYARFKGRVTFLGVDEQEPAGKVVPFAHSMGIRYPIAIDHGQLQASYRAQSVPTSVFIDRRGIVRALYRGPIPAALLQRYLAQIAGP